MAPPTTIFYNRFVRWARRGIRENLFQELGESGRSRDKQIDSTHIKAHRLIPFSARKIRNVYRRIAPTSIRSSRALPKSELRKAKERTIPAIFPNPLCFFVDLRLMHSGLTNC
jgi:transposase